MEGIVIKMNVKAYVLQTEGEEALIVAKRKSACASCMSGCEGCSKSKELKAVVKNSIGAQKGDFVVVKYAKVNLASFMVFILPIALGIAVYLIADSSARDYSGAIAVVVMLAGFLSLYAVVGRISYKFGRPEIEEILPEDNTDGDD